MIHSSELLNINVVKSSEMFFERLSYHFHCTPLGTFLVTKMFSLTSKRHILTFTTRKTMGSCMLTTGHFVDLFFLFQWFIDRWQL